MCERLADQGSDEKLVAVGNAKVLRWYAIKKKHEWGGVDWDENLVRQGESAVTSIMTEESEKHCSVGWITEQVGKKRVENYWL